jgi:hypothetical protein
MLCYASHHGRLIGDPHPDPDEVERQGWAYLRRHLARYRLGLKEAVLKPEREVSPAGSVQLLVRGPDGLPVEIVHLHTGLYEVED